MPWSFLGLSTTAARCLGFLVAEQRAAVGFKKLESIGPGESSLVSWTRFFPAVLPLASINSTAVARAIGLSKEASQKLCLGTKKSDPKQDSYGLFLVTHLFSSTCARSRPIKEYVTTRASGTAKCCGHTV